MAGEIDFADALRRRVRLLAGLKEADLEAVRDGIVLAPGARTLVRTLKRLGYELAVVSGGFTQVIDPLVTRPGHRPPGGQRARPRRGRRHRRAGRAHRRPGRARRRRWRRFAAAAGVPLARTIAVGDGANDIDMLAAAGLGIAFNAKPVVRQAADTALSVPYLDAILFLLGISRREVELADRLEQAGDRMTVLAQGEQGKSADNRGSARSCGAGCTSARSSPGWSGARSSSPPAPTRGRRRRCRSTWRACWRCSAPARPSTASAGRRRRGGACGGPTTARSSSGSRGRRRRWPGWRSRGGPRCSCSRMVWAGAAAGIALRQVLLDAPQWVVAIPYVVVGWCPIIVAPQLVRSLGWVGFSLMLAGGLRLHGRGARLRPQAAGPVAAGLRLPRGVPRLHAGRGGAVRLPRRLHRAAAVLSRRSPRGAPYDGVDGGPHVPSRPSIAMALPRMIRYTSSSERSRTICSATARVSGQVESVWG